MHSSFKIVVGPLGVLILWSSHASALGVGISTGCRIEGILGNFTTGVDPCIPIQEFAVDHALFSSGEQIVGVNSALTKFELDSAWRSNLDVAPSRPVLYTTYAARGNFGTVGVRTNSAGAGTLTSNGYAIAQSYAQVYFQDTIVLRSATLPFGSSVNVNFDYYLDGRAGAATPTNNTGVYSTLNGTFSIQDNLGHAPLSASFCGGQYAGTGCFSAGVGTHLPDFRVTSHALISLQVGFEYVFTSSLVAQSYAILDLRSGSVNPIDLLVGGSSRMDAFNTLNSFLTADTGDYQIVSGSGHDYSLAATVPEPAIYILMVAGLATVFSARRISPNSSRLPGVL